MGFLIFLAALTIVCVIWWDKLKYLFNNQKATLIALNEDKDAMRDDVRKLNSMVKRRESKSATISDDDIDRIILYSSSMQKLFNRVSKLENENTNLRKDLNKMSNTAMMYKFLEKELRENIIKSNTLHYQMLKYIEIITGKLPDVIDETTSKLIDDAATQKAAELFEKRVNETTKDLLDVADDMVKQCETAAKTVKKRAKTNKKRINKISQEINDGN